MANHASPASRIVAIILDSIILVIIMVILAIPFGLSSAIFSMMADYANMVNAWANAALWGTFAFLNLIISFAYFTYFEGTTGQTPGKRAMNIKVAREDGKKMTYADALIRTILRIVDGILFYLLGLIIILVTEKKQRLGDVLAKTIVVKA